jgi:DNA sulfur modification protein DndD
VIIEEVVLQNVGPYAGRQVIRLKPPSADKPVVLVAGLNGCGKTTLLEAIHLGLYGRQAHLSKKGSASYDAYLRRLISRRVRPDVGASIEIQLCRREERIQRTERIQRVWRVRGDRVEESWQVLVDGQLDPVLTDGWSEHIENILPSKLARLFFFDGEQVAQLADLDQSNELLQAAIHTLLGLDLVEQLKSDLAATERRQRIASAAAQGNEKLKERADQATAELRIRDEAMRSALQLRSSATTAVESAQRRVEEAKARLSAEGGDLLERRNDLEAELDSQLKRLRDAEERLRDRLTADAPLLAVEPLIRFGVGQAARERRAVQANEILGSLESRDRELMQVLERDAGADPQVLRLAGEFLAADRRERAKSVDGVEPWLGANDSDAQVMDWLCREGLPLEREALSESLRELESAQQAAFNCQRQLASVPSVDALKSAREQLSSAESELLTAQGRLAACGEQVVQEEKRRKETAAKAEKVISELEAIEFEEDRRARAAALMRESRTILDQFRHAIVTRHLERIEAAVLASYQQLLRKDGLVGSVRVDPVTFRISLSGKQGNPLHADDLSAGEKQLLAISILWGLATASGRRLPAIVDTPLGRLDGAHRTKLVRNYFPKASHQVVLLSTDEEVAGQYLEELRPQIGWHYELNFDDETESTMIACLTNEKERKTHATAP